MSDCVTYLRAGAVQEPLFDEAAAIVCLREMKCINLEVERTTDSDQLNYLFDRYDRAAQRLYDCLGFFP